MNRGPPDPDFEVIAARPYTLPKKAERCVLNQKVIIKAVRTYQRRQPRL